LTGFPSLVAALTAAGLRFVLIGVAGANHWARSGAAIFSTQDYDLFLPLDPEAELAAWRACQLAGLELWSHGEPLGQPLQWVHPAAVVDLGRVFAKCHTVRGSWPGRARPIHGGS
jgi:hypothetical protein